jgi:hypothetical protein
MNAFYPWKAGTDVACPMYVKKEAVAGTERGEYSYL